MHTIEAGPYSPVSAGCKCLDCVLDLTLRGRISVAPRQSVGDGRWRERPVAHHARLAAGVSELREYLAAMAMNRLDQAREAMHHPVLVDADLACRVLAAWVAEHVAAENETDLVSSQRLVNGDQLVSDLAR